VVCHGLQVRDLVLQYFNADPAEYQVVFTRSATGALKLVGETFPWSKWVMLLAAAAAEVDDHAMSVRGGLVVPPLPCSLILYYLLVMLLLRMWLMLVSLPREQSKLAFVAWAMSACLPGARWLIPWLLLLQGQHFCLPEGESQQRIRHA
jgi:hypothetical protein